jgi:hypothetical protein
MIAIPNRGRVVAVIWALALAGGLLTLVLLAKPSQAQVNGAVTTQMPIQGTVDASACAGEFIDIEGTIHTVTHFKDLGDGTFHANSHLTVNAKGTGLTTGKNYVLTSTGLAVENVVADGQYLATFQDVNMVLGNGQFPNQVSYGRLMFVISSEGEVKLENFHFVFECH